MSEHGDKLRFAIQHFHIQAGRLDVINNAGNHFVGVAVIVADAADPDGRDLPFVTVFHFRNGNVEFVPYAGDDRLHYHSFAFEGFIFGDAQVDFTNTDIHVK